MGISRLSFKLSSGVAESKTTLKIIVDGNEYVTSCFIVDDLLGFFRRHKEIAEDGRRFDLFFSGAEPYSVSLTRRGDSIYLRISDNFDGGVLEQAVVFWALKTAIVELSQNMLYHLSRNQLVRDELAAGLEDFKGWRGPVNVR